MFGLRRRGWVSVWFTTEKRVAFVRLRRESWEREGECLVYDGEEVSAVTCVGVECCFPCSQQCESVTTDPQCREQGNRFRCEDHG